MTMNFDSSFQSSDNMRQQLNITVPQDQIQAVFEKNYLRLQKTVKLSGFRQGKVPLNIIRKNYKSQVAEDVLSEIINQSFKQALEKHKVVPVSSPKIHCDTRPKEGEDFQFQVDFEVWPHLDVQFKELNLKVEKPEITDKDVDKTLKELRERSATQEIPVLENRPCQDKDIVEVDFLGTLHGKPFPGGEGKDAKVEVGSKAWLPDFEEGFKGMKAGEKKTIAVRFPEMYQEKTLAGQTASFEIHLKKILKKDLPELNDAWAQKLNPNCKTLDEFKKLIKTFLMQERVQDGYRKLKEETLTALRDKNSVKDFPPELFQNQLKLVHENAFHQLSQMKMPEDKFEEYKEKHKEDFQKRAKEILLSQKIIDDLARDQKIEVASHEVEQRFKEIHSTRDPKTPQLKPEEERQFKGQIELEILENKVIDFVLKENKISYP